MKNLTEGLHYYWSEDGLIVLTEHYHLEKGYCCGNGCRHCPWPADEQRRAGRKVVREG